MLHRPPPAHARRHLADRVPPAHSPVRAAKTAALTAEGFKDVGKGPGSTAAEFIEWLTIKDQAQSVVSDVTRIRTSPLVPKAIPIYGYIYDVHSGRLIEVPAATVAGRAA